jgi:YbgC/YbaW family acyl-CoA thioester hydrolase
MSTNKRPVTFNTRHRARFSDIDPYGHVNANHYLSYYIDHRFVGMRETLKWDLAILSKLRAAFVMKRVEIEFLSPLFADEEFEISSEISAFKERTCSVNLTMRKLEGMKEVSYCRMELACVDRKSGAPIDWPAEILNACFTTTEKP